MHVIKTLLRQLISGLRRIPNNIQSIYDNHSDFESESELYKKLIQTFGKTSQSLSKVFVLLDGLDECRGILRDVLLLIQAFTQSTIKVFVTCRPSIHMSIPMKAKTIQIESNKDDITNYIVTRLQREEGIKSTFDKKIRKKLITGDEHLYVPTDLNITKFFQIPISFIPIGIYFKV